MRIDDETIDAWFNKVMARFDRVEQMIQSSRKLHDVLDGDTFLENHDMCKLLGVTKRSLQRYRTKKLVPYYLADNGKCLYKASEVRDFLKKKGVRLEDYHPKK